MKKIMFDDRRGLTQAVLTGRKTMTRRIIPEKYKTMVDAAAKGVLIVPLACIPDGLSIEEFAEQWSKQSGRMRVVPVQDEPQIQYVDGKDKIMDLSRYQVGEEVAIAQKYIDLCNCDAFYEALEKVAPSFPLECIKGEKGCYNKMFVKADWMPHRIKMVDIKVEKLQDISEDDCLLEGIEWSCGSRGYYVNYNPVTGSRIWLKGNTAREAYADLIDKISGKGTWDRNPWVFAYSFKLVK